MAEVHGIDTDLSDQPRPFDPHPTEIERPADRAEWLRLRHGYANASDAAAYMGCHPFKTLGDVVVEKLQDGPEETSSRAMERGNRLESAVAEWWADEHGIAVYEPGVMYANGRLLATLDRRIIGVEREAVEVKTTNRLADSVQDYWWWQAQAQIHCADLDRVHFAVLDGTMDLRSYVVERDDEAIARLVAQIERVWSFIDLGMTPEGVELNAEQVARLHPQPQAGAVVEVEPDVVKRWLAAKSVLAEAEKAEKATRDDLCRLIGDAEGVTVGGVPWVTWKAQTRSSLDGKSLAADHPDLAKKYERTTAFRVLRPTKEAA